MNPETLERYGQFVKEAEASVDYWIAGPIDDFTLDICRLMEEKKVSKAELARRLGTSRAYVTKLLGGNANFTLATMVKVAMALDGAVRVHVADKRTVTRWRDEPRSVPSEIPEPKNSRRRRSGPKKPG